MLGSVAITEVQQILGFRSDKVTEITAALSFAQTEREKPGMTFPWWLWKEDQALTPLTINSQVLALPSDFIQDSPEREGNLRYRATGATTRTFFLKKMDYEQAEKHYFGDWQSDWDTSSTSTSSAISPGTPTAYVLRQNSIRIYPIPNAAYVLTWSYWGKDTAFSTGENAWMLNAPWVLIADAAKKLGSDLGNAQAVATASEIATRAESNLFRSVIHRSAAGRSRSMGSRL